MLMSKLFERFVQRTPVTVLARAAMEHAMAPEALDALFAQHADKQYTRELLFSSVVDLMSVVVAKIAPSVHAAYQAAADTLPVSVTSVYNKLNSLEPDVTSALVSHTAARLAPVITSMNGEVPALLPGYRVRILDGNHLAATERRLDVLRGSKAGPLPGHALVVLDPAVMLATHMIPCEDGHAQERSLSAEILELVNADDVWLADRNFCTGRLLHGIAERQAFYVIRHHANMTLVSAGTLRRRGRTETGEVWEQSVTLKAPDGEVMKARRIVVRLSTPTRDGDIEVAILTNLPKAIEAVTIADLYRKRWTLETMFQSLTVMLEGELATLGYPRAALFGFGIALAAYNTLSTVQAALRGEFGTEKVQEEVSGYYIANEVRATASGMAIAIEEGAWGPFQTMSPIELATQMRRWASKVQLRKLARHPRGPKKPVPKRTRYANTPHVSTARLLAGARKKAP
ncbi:MAG: IS4 family transposase [Actinobacteria bacterium]|nr:IS4 family transposase [Actinomycetota bacterium]